MSPVNHGEQTQMDNNASLEDTEWYHMDSLIECKRTNLFWFLVSFSENKQNFIWINISKKEKMSINFIGWFKFLIEFWQYLRATYITSKQNPIGSQRALI